MGWASPDLSMEGANIRIESKEFGIHSLPISPAEEKEMSVGHIVEGLVSFGSMCSSPLPM